jgi:hypothetical protein
MHATIALREVTEGYTRDGGVLRRSCRDILSSDFESKIVPRREHRCSLPPQQDERTDRPRLCHETVNRRGFGEAVGAGHPGSHGQSARRRRRGPRTEMWPGHGRLRS